MRKPTPTSVSPHSKSGHGEQVYANEKRFLFAPRRYVKIRPLAGVAE